MGELRKWYISKHGKDRVGDLQLFTKWVPQSEPMPRSVVEPAIDRSLQRMATESLDLMQFHWWDYEDMEYITALKNMQVLQKEGKIKHLALTNFDTERLRIMYKNGIQIVSNQVSYSVIDRRPEKEMVKFCLEHDIKLLTYGTLLGGFLSEKWIGVAEPTSKTQLNTSSLGKYKKFIDHWGPWGLFQELLTTMKTIADKHNVAVSNVATFVLPP
jgi:aryl-alcohol dehydrogenase-like predicted oxidoreductase